MSAKVVHIARCPEHGLHGERTECFVCKGPVEQVPMVELSRDPEGQEYAYRARSEQEIRPCGSEDEARRTERIQNARRVSRPIVWVERALLGTWEKIS